MCQDLLTPFLEVVLSCVLDRAQECSIDGWCRAGVVGGNVAWDDCCDCGTGNGQLWVRLIAWQPDPDFPVPNPSSGCEQPTLISIGIGSLRCVPVMDDNGNAPSAEDEADSAARINLDAQLIHDAVMCCLQERTWVGWESLGYEGGCGGGEHIYLVPWFPCRCGASLESP